MKIIAKSVVAVSVGALIAIGGVGAPAMANGEDGGSVYCDVGHVAAIRSNTAGFTEHHHNSTQIDFANGLQKVVRYSGAGFRSEQWAVFSLGDMDINGTYAYCTT